MEEEPRTPYCIAIKSWGRIQLYNFFSASASLNHPALPTMLNLTVNRLCNDQVMPSTLQSSDLGTEGMEWNVFFFLYVVMWDSPQYVVNTIG